MTQTPDILKKILRQKVEEITARGDRIPLRELAGRVEHAPATRGFADALTNKVKAGDAAVIAELKKASPSKGLLREDFRPAEIARGYERAGATCLSVLTDVAFFQGSDADLGEVRSACSLPVIRKDFIIDPYQVYEARTIGADCILLIVACLSDTQLSELSGLAHHLGMDVLTEVHDATELHRALAIPGQLVGINNRNLRNFHIDLSTTLNLLDEIPPERLVITESGIHRRDDIALMRRNGVNAFLVGESFMRAPDPAEKLVELFGL
ncbi:MAG: indole-3-glycerol phosphate synthase TrpC [Thiohalocapsa sp. PB-PSB1]|jgi:indole-3-glycerol phosphate synthase|nr:MAG: hypothetical protein N838_16885 [Thiohalocapsa sp. PB-PSB1]QQO57072.1 MAG: indole-3-glycerol phosphate synthase TrpC [Thiohalocapsa sp. PB-PSB1]HCS91216.1 indole-3-glycerol phosphate synthase TrpC [Chromatiaceae bacterium]